MEDRELLELAAKVAGIHAHHWFDQGGVLMCSSVEGGDPDYGWNPLTDDGDALRLAIDLRMDVSHWPDDTVTAHCLEGKPVQEDYGSDPYAATRRAIVRAAAELGSRSNAAVTRRAPGDTE
jgi:hypothetical protein